MGHAARARPPAGPRCAAIRSTIFGGDSVSMPRTVRSRVARLALAASMLGFASVAAAIPAGAVDAITLSTPFPAIAVAPGATPSFDISVKTDTAGRVDLTVGTVPAGWTAVLHGGGF